MTSPLRLMTRDSTSKRSTLPVRHHEYRRTTSPGLRLATMSRQPGERQFLIPLLVRGVEFYRTVRATVAARSTHKDFADVVYVVVLADLGDFVALEQEVEVIAVR